MVWKEGSWPFEIAVFAAGAGSILSLTLLFAVFAPHLNRHVEIGVGVLCSVLAGNFLRIYLRRRSLAALEKFQKL